MSLARIRHVICALLVALGLGASGILAPVDLVLWTGQARLMEREASGDIVFISVPGARDGRMSARKRTEIAHLVERLGHLGAGAVYLDILFDAGGDADADRALRQALETTGGAHAVARYATRAAGETLLRSNPVVTGRAPTVVSKNWVDPFGFVWTLPFEVRVDGERFASLPAALARHDGSGAGEFRIDYAAAYETIPVFALPDALDQLSTRGADYVGGRTFVIGLDAQSSDGSAAVPGHPLVPKSMVAIYGAETLLKGAPRVLWWGALVAAMAVLTAAASLLRRRSMRCGAYAVIVGLAVVSPVAMSVLRLSVEFAPVVVFLVAHAGLRCWHHWQERPRLVSAMTGLPTFRKLELDLGRLPTGRRHAVVVAKIHRFDDVLATLPPDHHREYIQLLANRFRVADEELVIYSGDGRYFAWMQELEAPEQLSAHLKGLRAIVSNPLRIGDAVVDAATTFGADLTAGSTPQQRISSAMAMVDRTTEAHEPVLLVDETAQAERLWNVSLQSKIDEALASGEIYVVYQPQFALPARRLFGVEALVRWDDPERGSISPAYFIEQCEHAGRMETLTRKVLDEAIGSFMAATSSAPWLQLSVNVSATLLSDRLLVDIVKEVLDRHGFPPRRLTLEITETSRIADFDVARAVLQQLRLLGIRISIDDFGMGAANLETFLLLPFDELKIDRAFVSRMQHNDKARQIVESLIDFGRRMSIHTVAEGVEDAVTLRMLEKAACRIAQGYGLGRPARLDTFISSAIEQSREAAAGS